MAEAQLKDGEAEQSCLSPVEAPACATVVMKKVFCCFYC